MKKTYFSPSFETDGLKTDILLLSGREFSTAGEYDDGFGWEDFD